MENDNDNHNQHETDNSYDPTYPDRGDTGDGYSASDEFDDLPDNLPVQYKEFWEAMLTAERLRQAELGFQVAGHQGGRNGDTGGPCRLGDQDCTGRCRVGGGGGGAGARKSDQPSLA